MPRNTRKIVEAIEMVFWMTALIALIAYALAGCWVGWSW